MIHEETIEMKLFVRTLTWRIEIHIAVNSFQVTNLMPSFDILVVLSIMQVIRKSEYSMLDKMAWYVQRIIFFAIVSISVIAFYIQAEV